MRRPAFPSAVFLLLASSAGCSAKTPPGPVGPLPPEGSVCPPAHDVPANDARRPPPTYPALRFEKAETKAASYLLPAGWQGDGSKARLVACNRPLAGRERIVKGALATKATFPEANTGKSETRQELKKLAQLGGDYWNVPVDIGSVGECYLDTSLTERVDLLSPELPRTGRYVTLLVGGGNAETTSVALCKGTAAQCVPFATNFSDRGPAQLAMHRIVWDLGADYQDSGPLRIRVRAQRDGADKSRLDFLFVDDITRGDQPPVFKPPRLWGFADLHAHLFNNAGSGGRIIHGDVFAGGNAFSPPAVASGDVLAKMEKALGRSCDIDHNAGGHSFSPEPLCHATEGYPTFKGWPRYGSVAHQQTYVDWIERAYRGGLRLINVDVGNSRLFGAVYEHINPGLVPALADIHAPPRRLGDGVVAQDFSEATAMREELALANRFVAPGAGPANEWAAIARSPEEARTIAASGKLILVLGMEMDHPEEAFQTELAAVSHEPHRARPILRRYVSRLHDLGIRHVHPIHALANAFGASAVYSRRFFCAALPQNGALAPLASGVSSGVRYHVNRDSDAMEGMIEFLIANSLDPLFGRSTPSDLDSHLGPAAKGDCFKVRVFPPPLNLSAAASLANRALGQAYDIPSTIAAGGLTSIGKIYVEELMRQGMLIDLTHMSERARADTIAIAKPFGYPLMASHVGFRELSMGNRLLDAPSCRFGAPADRFDPAVYGTSDVKKVGAENALTRKEAQDIRSDGGLVGVGLGMSGVGVTWRPTDAKGGVVPLDCDGTSKSFAQAYRYAREMLGAGIAIGTDINGFQPQPPPRFYDAKRNAPEDACNGASGDERRAPIGRQEQHGLVCYDDDSRCSTSDPMHPYVVQASDGGKRFDVNYDGVAHYGLLPDFLEDLHNVGVTEDELATLFEGVEDYVEMWEQAENRAADVRAKVE